MKKMSILAIKNEDFDIFDDGAARFDSEQMLTEEQKTQVCSNIGIADFYHNDREEVEVSSEVKASDIYALYDALAEEFNEYKKKDDGDYEVDDKGEKIPILIRVQKNILYSPKESDPQNLEIREYVISTGEYKNTEGLYSITYCPDGNIKKPKYLITNSLHGVERRTSISTYRFIRDVLRGHNVPKAFAEGAIIKVIPVANPTGFDAFTRSTFKGEDLQGNIIPGVDINRNFDYNWFRYDNNEVLGVKYTFGTAANSEIETQTISNWLQENKDAKLYIDFHNSGQIYEIATILGLPDAEISDRLKKTALCGVDRVIPYWRDVIDYPDTVKFDGLDKQVIFSYSASADIEGGSYCYAQRVVGIPSICIETSTYPEDCDFEQANGKYLHPEAIAMGADILGNILIEFYNNPYEIIPTTYDFEYENIEFEQGGISTSTGEDSTSSKTKRLRSGFISVENITRVISTDPVNYHMYVFFYDNTNKLIYKTYWYVPNFVAVQEYVLKYPNISKIRILVRRQDTGVLTPADVAGMYKLEMGTIDIVRLGKQELTDKQKAQVRENIGIDLSDYVTQSEFTPVVEELQLFASALGDTVSHGEFTPVAEKVEEHTYLLDLTFESLVNMGETYATKEYVAELLGGIENGSY